MIDINDINEVDEIDEVDDLDETQDPDSIEGPAPGGAKSRQSSNVGEASVEIDVEDLIAELEADAGVKCVTDEQSARKRLERVLEERRASQEIEELDEFTLSEYEYTD